MLFAKKKRRSSDRRKGGEETKSTSTISAKRACHLFVHRRAGGVRASLRFNNGTPARYLNQRQRRASASCRKKPYTSPGGRPTFNVAER